MSETQHTPTPWAAHWRFIGTADEADPQTIAYADDHRNRNTRPAEEHAANAAFIVRACNVHDELVAALAELVKCHDGGGFVKPDAAVLAAARAMLAKAEGAKA